MTPAVAVERVALARALTGRVAVEAVTARALLALNPIRASGC
jgi:hypothetical protein